MFELQNAYSVNEGKTIRIFPAANWVVDITNKDFNFLTKSMILEVRLVDKDNKSNFLSLLSYPVTEEGVPNPDNPQEFLDSFDYVWANYIDTSSGGPIFNKQGVQWLISKVPNLNVKLGG